MKICSQVAYLTLALLAPILVISLASCGGTTATPAIVDTVSVPSATPILATPTSVAPTMPLPSATPVPPTIPAPTQTPPPTPTLPPPTAAETSTTAPTPGNLPVDGVWTGGGTKLLIDFMIQTSNGETTLSNVGIVWQGRNECDLNGRFNLSVPLNEDGFVMNYTSDEVTFILSGTPVSSTVIEGNLNLKVEDCGSHQVPWRAVPKAGAGSAP